MTAPLDEVAPGAPRVSTIIVSYNTRDLTLAAVGSVLDQQGVSCDVWVVDNASTDGSVDAIRSRFPKVNVIESKENLGFGAANNLGMDTAGGGCFLLLNSDAELRRKDDLARLLEVLGGGSRIGALGPRLENQEAVLEFSARRFPSGCREIVRRTGLYRVLPRSTRERYLLGDFFAHDEPVRADWITGACMLVRREAVVDAGGFDPGIFMYGEEQEWCYRIRQAGWEIMFDPSVSVMHRRAASSGSSSAEWRTRRAQQGDLYLFAKHRGRVARWWFYGARLMALIVEGILYGTAAMFRGQGYFRDRASDARRQLRSWLRVGRSVQQ